MRNVSNWAAAIIAPLMANAPQIAVAEMPDVPRAPRMLQHISFQSPMLAPMAFHIFRGGPVRLTAARWEELKEVNDLVNAAIAPERNDEGLAGEKWLIAPESGD